MGEKGDSPQFPQPEKHCRPQVVGKYSTDHYDRIIHKSFREKETIRKFPLENKEGESPCGGAGWKDFENLLRKVFRLS